MRTKDPVDKNKKAALWKVVLPVAVVAGVVLFAARVKRAPSAEPAAAEPFAVVSAETLPAAPTVSLAEAPVQSAAQEPVRAKLSELTMEERRARLSAEHRRELERRQARRERTRAEERHARRLARAAARGEDVSEALTWRAEERMRLETRLRHLERELQDHPENREEILRRRQSLSNRLDRVVRRDRTDLSSQTTNRQGDER